MQSLAPFKPILYEFFCLGKKFLIFNLISRNLKTKYRRSVFGLFWTLIAPAGMAAVYYFVFKVILKVQVPHYLAFILSGVLTWNFFAQSVLEGMESIVGNQGLLTKVPIPVQVFPYVGTLTNLVTLSLSLPILFAAGVVSAVSFGAPLVLLPFYVGVLFVMAYSLSVILGIAYVFLRDLRHAMGLVFQIWFYGTPVIYDEAMIPEKWRWVLFANPLGTVFTGLHDIFVRGAWPPAETLGVTLIWTAILFVLAILGQRRFARGLVENI